MKAVQVVGYHTKLQLTDIPEPQIEGPLDVIVRIGGAGVCRTDIHILEGQWAEKSGVALPYTIGHENAGWVHSVGDAVTNVTVGDKVILHPLITCGLAAHADSVTTCTARTTNSRASTPTAATRNTCAPPPAAW